MELESRIIDKITKLKELSERGVEGEALAAKRALQFHLDKYHVSLDDLFGEEETKSVYTFRYSSHSEKVILIQCVTNLFGSESDAFKDSYRYRDGTMKLYFTLSKFEYALLDDLYRFHRDQLKQQLKEMEEKLLTAYIHNQGLYDKTPKQGKSKSKYSLEELLDILTMSDNLLVKGYRKSLTSNI